MRPVPRFFALVAPAVALFLGLPVAGSHEAAGAADDFTLTASIVGLYPGADLDHAVTVDNPLDAAISIRSASATVGDASIRCTAANLRAEPFAGDVVVGAHDTGAVPVRIRMAASAPDACQGATFPLTFTAYGYPVSPTPARPSPHGVGTTGSGSGFAFTGADPRTPVVIGVGALGLGVALLARRRRPSSANS